MQRIAPLSLADSSWDNVGILVENPSPCGSHVVMLTIDLTAEVLEEAIREKVGVVIAYHPVIFSGLKALQLPRDRVVLGALTHGISVYSPHTSLDAVEGGINDWLASIIDPIGSVTPIQPLPEKIRDKFSAKCGMGRVLELSAPITMEEAVRRVKAGLSLPHVRVAGATAGKAIRSVGICAGSGGSLFRQLHNKKVDLLLTGEMGHHEVLAAVASGTSVILCEHTNTERGFLTARLEELVRSELKTEVADLRVFTSMVDKDPLTVV